MELLEMMKDNNDGTFSIVSPCSFEKPSREEALKLADELDGLNSCEPVIIKACEDMIRRLVEELDKKQQGLIEASGMLFNYKYELDLERAMSAQLKEELDRHK